MPVTGVLSGVVTPKGNTQSNDEKWAIITYKDGIYDLSHEFPAVA